MKTVTGSPVHILPMTTDVVSMINVSIGLYLNRKETELIGNLCVENLPPDWMRDGLKHEVRGVANGRHIIEALRSAYLTAGLRGNLCFRVWLTRRLAACKMREANAPVAIFPYTETGFRHLQPPRTGHERIAAIRTFIDQKFGGVALA